jgi:uncharacterized membrane protein (UPF0127 family)
MIRARERVTGGRWLAAAILLLVVRAGTTEAAEDCARWRAAFARMPSRVIVIEAGARTLRLPVRVAEDPEQQAAGFQCATRAEIAETQILFDFGLEITAAFHMRNVVAPLDIAFAKTDGRIFSIQRMVPSETFLYQPMGAFRYALETRAGFLERAGIRAGGARLVPTR